MVNKILPECFWNVCGWPLKRKGQRGPRGNNDSEHYCRLTKGSIYFFHSDCSRLQSPATLLQLKKDVYSNVSTVSLILGVTLLSARTPSACRGNLRGGVVSESSDGGPLVGNTLRFSSSLGLIHRNHCIRQLLAFCSMQERSLL